jgi:hypothetical protein
MGKPIAKILTAAPDTADLLRQDWPNDRCPEPDCNPNLDRYAEDDD